MSGSDPTLLPTPELQFIDANGVPYASGTLALYVPGTTTPKNSWIDWQGTVLNTNPITLDAAGRCIVWGDGDYRCILNDAAGNLIFDQISTTLVSGVMVPVVSAPTLQAARDAMGITDAIATETNRALAAEQALTNSQVSQADLAAETSRAEAAETTLTNNLNAEITRAKAAEAALAGGAVPTVQAGHNASGADGTGTFTFAVAFPNACDAVTASATGVGWWVSITSITVTGFSVTTSSPLHGSGGAGWQGGPMDFYWTASGH
jgi:hypothetical protein